MSHTQLHGRRDREIHARLHEFARQVVLHLGLGWRYDAEDCNEAEGPCRWATVRHQDGYGFSLHASNDRIEVSPEYPRDGEHRGSQRVMPHSSEKRAPSITVAATKTPEQVARDIERRVLPGYLPIWEECCQRLRDTQQARRERDEGAEQIIAALKKHGICGHQRQENRDGDCYVGFDLAEDFRHGYGDLRIGCSSVEIELRRLPVSAALEIIEAIGRWIAVRRGGAA